MHIGYLWESQIERDHQEDRGIGGWIISYYFEYKTPSNLRHTQFLNEGVKKKSETCIYFNEFI
jgi:hypothetical protein